MFERFVVSRDDQFYYAFPDLALTPQGKLICVFLACTHHVDRSYTQIMQVTSTDRGRTWTPAQPLSAPLNGDPANGDPFWDCPRIVALADGRLAVLAARIAGPYEGNQDGEQSIWLWFSHDDGATWEGPHATPARGIVPDRLLVLTTGPHAGRWLLSAHTAPFTGTQQKWMQRCWWSDDQGATWNGPQIVATAPNLKLCEGSMVQLPTGEIACFLRENSGRGLDAFTALSTDGGITWQGPDAFPLPGCHRPVAGMLASGRVLITYRFWQGSGGWAHNFFAALTDQESCRTRTRSAAHTRIMPLDYDRATRSDTGYSGWVQFPDGEIYIVNYIVDDASKAQIRGYTLGEGDFALDADGALWGALRKP